MARTKIKMTTRQRFSPLGNLRLLNHMRGIKAFKQLPTEYSIKRIVLDQQRDIRDRLARSAWNPWHSNEEIDDPWAGLLRDLDGGVPVVGDFSHIMAIILKLFLDTRLSGLASPEYLPRHAETWTKPAREKPISTQPCRYGAEYS